MMEEDELFNHAMAMIMKISIITGWQVPENREYVTVLVGQLKLKMQESYSELNIDEFDFAMRECGTQIKDWGKSLNLSLIDNAISEYLQKRKLLSEIEERVKPVEQLPMSTTPVDWSEVCEELLQKAKDGQIESAIIPMPVYFFLTSNGYLIISNKEKNELLGLEVKSMIANLEKEVLTTATTPQQYHKLAQLRSGDITPDLLTELKNNARRSATRAYFKNLAKELKNKN